MLLYTAGQKGDCITPRECCKANEANGAIVMLAHPTADSAAVPRSVRVTRVGSLHERVSLISYGGDGTAE